MHTLVLELEVALTFCLCLYNVLGKFQPMVRGHFQVFYSLRSGNISSIVVLPTGTKLCLLPYTKRVLLYSTLTDILKWCSYDFCDLQPIKVSSA